jgi:hypothetical protein
MVRSLEIMLPSALSISVYFGHSLSQIGDRFVAWHFLPLANPNQNTINVNHGQVKHRVLAPLSFLKLTCIFINLTCFVDLEALVIHRRWVPGQSGTSASAFLNLSRRMPPMAGLDQARRNGRFAPTEDVAYLLAVVTTSERFPFFR